MAENKYDLLLISQNPEKIIKQQPWYKERLRTKYIKSLKPGDTSKLLVGKNWSFLKYGLDDFRDGLPPKISDGNEFLKGAGFGPNLTGVAIKLPPISQSAVKGRFSKKQIAYDKRLPLPQLKQEHIQEIESNLKAHPLAIYSHLENCLPADLYEDIVDLLDPEMNFIDEDDAEEIENVEEKAESEKSIKSQTRSVSVSKAGTERFSRLSTSRSIQSTIKQNKDDNKPTMPNIIYPGMCMKTKREAPSSIASSLRNPYKWVTTKTESGTDPRLETPTNDGDISSVTKEFCDWIASLGGETNNIEESTITSLFASGYETKPALSVPIHVVELTNVPPELRMAANANPQPIKKTADEEKPTWKTEDENNKNMTYGAWYLPVKSWKKRAKDEPLTDPKVAKQAEKSEMKVKSDDLDHELANLHGAQAFIEFMNTKNTRRPEFLNHISAIQEQKRKEEEHRLALEEAKKAKLRRQAKKAEDKEKTNT